MREKVSVDHNSCLLHAYGYRLTENWRHAWLQDIPIALAITSSQHPLALTHSELAALFALPELQSHLRKRFAVIHLDSAENVAAKQLGHWASTVVK